MKLLRRFKEDKAFRYRMERYFWIAIIPIWWFFLRNSIAFVNFLSLYALIISAAAAEQAARKK
jgi:hypothetical protein